jgi:Dr1-associated corepressor
MQADEDIGKVAQATPTAAAKALELFMASLTVKAAQEATNAGTKRITVNHLKAAIARDSNFDFLTSICESAADEEKSGGGGGKKGRGKSEDVSDDEAGFGGSGVVKGGKKRKGSDDDVD